MRKGFTLVEVLVVVIVLPFIFVLLDGLFTTLLADIPRSYQFAQESITLQNLLEQMQQDMDRAKGLPESFVGLTADEKQFLIELPDGVLCYQQNNDQIIRRKLRNASQDGVEEKRAWSLPHTKVEWTILEKDSQSYAVEVKTHIEYKTRGKWKKTMANSHLYYGGALR
jgi:prepilin-type N-terminal cleavage/methylation domain-containing protein